MASTTSVRIDHAHVTTNSEGDLVIKKGSLTGARVVLLNSTIEVLPGTEFNMEPWGPGSQYKGNRIVGAPLLAAKPAGQGNL
jgi:hypothetical protein